MQTLSLKTISVMALASLLLPIAAYAGHNGAVVDTDVSTCDATKIEAQIADPSGTHKVSNMHLVVDVNGNVQTQVIPTDGTVASISVGPFPSDTTVSYRVFGGGERDYDDPQWNSGDIGAYISANGDGWTLEGTDDPNPFVNWHTLTASGCEDISPAQSVAGGGAQPWCFGPTAPGWNVSLPGGGCIDGEVFVAQGASYVLTGGALAGTVETCPYVFGCMVKTSAFGAMMQ